MITTKNAATMMLLITNPAGVFSGGMKSGGSASNPSNNTPATQKPTNNPRLVLRAINGGAKDVGARARSGQIVREVPDNPQRKEGQRLSNDDEKTERNPRGDRTGWRIDVAHRRRETSIPRRPPQRPKTPAVGPKSGKREISAPENRINALRAT